MGKQLIVVFIALLMNIKAFAQYEPTTTWPYVYAEFQPGELLSVNKSAQAGLYNIHLQHGHLHFIDGELIREASATDVVTVKIGSDLYVNSGGTMMRVLLQKDGVYVAETSEVDYNQLNSTGGAYGSSSTTLATSAFSSLESIGTGVTAVNHIELKNSKDEGKVLPLIIKKYLIFAGYKVYATRKDVMDLNLLDSKELSAFIKEKKIKWKDSESLLELGLYLNEKVTLK